MKKLVLTMVMALGMSMLTNAQGFYDDDIYYSASKAKKEKQEQAQAAAEKIAAANYVPNKSQDFPGADTYVVSSGSTRDVDEYNRRGINHSVDSLHGDSLYSNIPFAYTRQIERFHNPDIVNGSNDETLQYLYYVSENEREKAKEVTQVNIYVDSPWGWSSWPYYGYGWGWGPGWWNSWYYPSWSFYWDWGPSWAWGPSWNWGWGPSWSWGWGPGWNWGPGWAGPVGPGWAGPAPRPTSPGAMATHRPGGTVYQGTVGGHRGNSGVSNTVPSTTTRNGQRPGASQYNNRNTISNSSRTNSSTIRNSGSSSSGTRSGGGFSTGGTRSGGGSSGGRGGRH